MTRSLLLCFVAVCAGAVPSAPVAGQEDAVTMQLDSAVVLAKSEGFSQQGNWLVGALEDGGSTTLPTELRAGLTYLIVGVCDYDCTDVDLILDDPSGDEVVSDLLADDAPVLTADIATAGAYSVTVNMAACSVDPCNYGVAIFAK